MEQQKPLVVQIDGGLGRIICAIPALEQMAKTRRVIVLTTFPEVFWNNPNIYKVYNLNREYLWDDVIKHGEFLNPEPYHNHKYYNQELHLIQTFNLLITGDAGDIVTPNLYLSSEEEDFAEEFISARKREFGKDIVMLQCFGSGASVSNQTTHDTSNRSLPVKVVDAICNNTDILYINASHINMDYRNVWQQTFTSRQIFALTSRCDFVVGIDSYLLHVGNAFRKQGLAFFGGTFPENLGYSQYQIIRKSGFPVSYVPNRMTGYVNENNGALEFDNVEISQILRSINEQTFKNKNELDSICDQLSSDEGTT